MSLLAISFICMCYALILFCCYKGMKAINDYIVWLRGLTPIPGFDKPLIDKYVQQAKLWRLIYIISPFIFVGLYTWIIWTWH